MPIENVADCFTSTSVRNKLCDMIRLIACNLLSDSLLHTVFCIVIYFQCQYINTRIFFHQMSVLNVEGC